MNIKIFAVNDHPFDCRFYQRPWPCWSSQSQLIHPQKRLSGFQKRWKHIQDGIDDGEREREREMGRHYSLYPMCHTDHTVIRRFPRFPTCLSLLSVIRFRNSQSMTLAKPLHRFQLHRLWRTLGRYQVFGAGSGSGMISEKDGTSSPPYIYIYTYIYIFMIIYIYILFNWPAFMIVEKVVLNVHSCHPPVFATGSERSKGSQLRPVVNVGRVAVVSKRCKNMQYHLFNYHKSRSVNMIILYLSNNRGLGEFHPVPS